MNTIMVILIEVIFILFILLIGLLFVSWKRKKSKKAEFEQLLNEISGREEDRKVLLIEYLTRHQRMDNQAALESCEDFIEAEKQFMYLFLEQQIKQMPLTGFYENLCGLLDKYINLLPEAIDNKEAEKQSSEQEPESDSGQMDDSLEEEGESDSKQTDDSLEEGGGKSDSEEEEPDWGDAFAESGDEVDESAKQEYDAEAGKEGQ